MRMLRFALIALAAVALAGCTASAPPSATQAPSQTETPAATSEAPEPAEPEIAEIVVDGTGFSLVDTEGTTTFTHLWADEVDAAVAALTDAFGADPVTSVRDGSGGHYVDFDLYTWGEFTLGDAVGLEKPRTDYFLPSLVEVTAPEVEGIAVRSASGPTVGSPTSEVAAVSPLVHDEADYRIDPEDPSLIPPTPPRGDITDMVGLRPDESDTTIVMLTAPVLSYYPF
ncbi:hypothetical protein MUN74_15085 [Agromyces endophyticus]|uniref:hypothetical protein n=1 Tax=Agromyces sp. H17E-10 TaxID=2932244 RepID=UPI001FCF82CE|nr:hypothetical protein [Agromyces sp. H17E-10]UOQ88579.1 hypothetical protein MUN74_15085 [Agromyces sp. H17E-10]